MNNQPDPRSFVGIFSRGRNDYQGSFSPQGAGRPRNVTPAIERKLQAPTMAEFGGAIKRRLDGFNSRTSRTA